VAEYPTDHFQWQYLRKSKKEIYFYQINYDEKKLYILLQIFISVRLKLEKNEDTQEQNSKNNSMNSKLGQRKD
ncbi:MAG TPA: hypothetical protein DHV62_09085, partial [Elusimicrobia bacterium]|nr:hypothetical protein [Elusimicrobiota bacterium]